MTCWLCYQYRRTWTQKSRVHSLIWAISPKVSLRFVEQSEYYCTRFRGFRVSRFLLFDMSTLHIPGTGGTFILYYRDFTYLVVCAWITPAHRILNITRPYRFNFILWDYPTLIYTYCIYWCAPELWDIVSRKKIKKDECPLSHPPTHRVIRYLILGFKCWLYFFLNS